MLPHPPRYLRTAVRATSGIIYAIGCMTGCAALKPTMVVNVPVSDLRALPNTRALPNAHDPQEETQLLYGERVRVFKIQDGWVRVEALEQPEFTHAHHWQGYPGWMPLMQLIPEDLLLSPTIVVTEPWASTWQDPYLSVSSPWRFAMGTRLRATNIGETLWRVELFDGNTVWLPRRAAVSLGETITRTSQQQRQLIVQYADQLLGSMYYWGGRSPTTSQSDGQITGVDCSGLTNLVYRTAGVEIPRDAHEQFLRAKTITTLRPADLIFLSDRADPTRIVHVMLYAGDGAVIEGPGTGLAVRRLSVVQRFGRSLDQLKSGTSIDGQRVFFGSYLP